MLTANLAAVVSGEPLILLASSLRFRNSRTTSMSAPKSAASPSALTIPGLLANSLFDKSTV